MILYWLPEDNAEKSGNRNEYEKNQEKLGNYEVKQVSEFEKDELFDPNNIAALIDKSRGNGHNNQKTDALLQNQIKI